MAAPTADRNSRTAPPRTPGEWIAGLALVGLFCILAFGAFRSLFTGPPDGEPLVTIFRFGLGAVFAMLAFNWARRLIGR